MKNKLKACGIIVEYNPFHHGHIHHIKEAKKIYPDHTIVAVMSPNFVQRGEPAIINKWERTQAALDNGVDLVIELPTYYALQAAEQFAYASIELLKLAKVEAIVYGAENPQETDLPELNKDKMNLGYSYAHSINKTQLGSNDILKNAYEKNLINTNITSHAIQRTNNYLDQNLSGPISSASAIRKAYFENEPYEMATPMSLVEGHHFDDYLPLIRYALLSQNNLNKMLLMDEGIENLFLKNINKNIVESCISRRYTRSRIQRTLMQCLLNNKKETRVPLTQLRVLGMDQKGQSYLRQLKNEAVNFTTSFKNYINKDLELKASQIYALPYSMEYQIKTYKMEIETLIIKL